MPTIRMLASIALVACLLLTAFAGILGPGTYIGVVVFDRWDACYLYGERLMYVSEATKAALRPYRGRSIRLHALDVYQPINPGDGRINRFDILGPTAPEKDGMLDRLVLRAEGRFHDVTSSKLAIRFRNESGKVMEVSSSDLSVAVLLKKEVDNLFIFDPSDGPSFAIIPGMQFWESGKWIKGGSKGKSDGRKFSYLYAVQAEKLPARFTLAPSAEREFVISFRLPAGKYDALFAYSAGIQDGPAVTSDSVAFHIDANGNAAPVSVDKH